MSDKQISDQALRVLAYWRAALADSCLIHPKVPENCEPIEVERSGNSWIIKNATKEWVERMYAASKRASADENEKKKPIPFLLTPGLLAPESMHGTKRGAAQVEDCLVPLCIPCLLTAEGSLLVDSDRFPWIPRDLLEPSVKDVTIGTLDSLDAYISQRTRKPDNLDEMMQMANELFASVAGAQLSPLHNELSESAIAIPTLAIENFASIEKWFGFPYDPSPPAVHIISLYDRITDQKPAVPLLESLARLSDRPAGSPVPLAEAELRIKGTVGHINHIHPLSPSQHEAMNELLGLKKAEVLAVNGPPGTGKTTLLQSVVAQNWIMAAINDAPCPIITATSTNVKAVENVLDSFAKLGAEISHERWLPDIGGFGLFLASASRDSDHPVYNSPKEHHFIQFETPVWVNRAKTFYMARAQAFAGLGTKPDTVQDVVKALKKLLVNTYSSLKNIVELRYKIFSATASSTAEGATTSIDHAVAKRTKAIKKAEEQVALANALLAQCEAQRQAEQKLHVSKLNDIRAAEAAWNAYLGTLSSLLFGIFSFIPPVKRTRNARDRVFLLSNPLTSELNHREDDIDGHFARLIRQEKLRSRGVLNEISELELGATSRKRDAEQEIATLAAEIKELEQLRKRWNDCLTGQPFQSWRNVTLEGLNDVLDVGVRAPMFKLADWYWSGAWLIEMEERLRDNAQDSKSPPKLESMLRRFAKITPCMVSNFHMVPSFFCGWLGDQPRPLWNLIDLLIVDEAGQVSPEVGAPAFAVAKQAIVVGDVYQIEPIWNIPESIDRANAVKFGIIKSTNDARYEKLDQDGYTSARGNLMMISSRACRLQKYPDVRGLLLTEHRRCVPDLIDYCNRLVYGGRLLPCRPPIPEEKAILPTYGYLSVISNDKRVGGSRSNYDEAAAIADWIVEHRSRLEQHYLDPNTNEPQHISRILAVITPFSPQASLISNLLRKRMPDTRKRGMGITVGTVHRLQGGERNVVIFSPVYGHDHKGSTFFDRGRNMMNVAVSRAKDSFLVFGNLHLFDPKKDGMPSGLLAQYLYKRTENNMARQANLDALYRESASQDE